MPEIELKAAGSSTGIESEWIEPYWPAERDDPDSSERVSDSLR